MVVLLRMHCIKVLYAIKDEQMKLMSLEIPQIMKYVA